jgi:hypothetical protein
MDGQFEIKGVIFIDDDTIECVVGRVGDGWVEPVMEATYLNPELSTMKRTSVGFEKNHESLIATLIEIRDQIFSSFALIPVQLMAGSVVRRYDRRNELNWLIEEATGYRMTVLNEQEESRFTVISALQGNVFDESGFISLVDQIKKASETDAF